MVKTRSLTISWIWAEDEPFDISVLYDTELDDLRLCEQVYKQTNLYQGDLWDRIEEFLPATRSHTALSVGDAVMIDGITYECRAFGFGVKEGEKAEPPL